MTTLKELNAHYGTDWKRGDIVETLPDSETYGGERYQLTGFCAPSYMFLVGKRLGKHATKKRALLNPTTIKRVQP